MELQAALPLRRSVKACDAWLSGAAVLKSCGFCWTAAPTCITTKRCRSVLPSTGCVGACVVVVVVVVVVVMMATMMPTACSGATPISYPASWRPALICPTPTSAPATSLSRNQLPPPPPPQPASPSSSPSAAAAPPPGAPSLSHLNYTKTICGAEISFPGHSPTLAWCSPLPAAPATTQSSG
jgi:hypothetical protein